MSVFSFKKETIDSWCLNYLVHWQGKNTDKLLYTHVSVCQLFIIHNPTAIACSSDHGNAVKKKFPCTPYSYKTLYINIFLAVTLYFKGAIQNATQKTDMVVRMTFCEWRVMFLHCVLDEFVSLIFAVWMIYTMRKIAVLYCIASYCTSFAFFIHTSPFE